jgi:hypothetical protein
MLDTPGVDVLVVRNCLVQNLLSQVFSLMNRKSRKTLLRFEQVSLFSTKLQEKTSLNSLEIEFRNQFLDHALLDSLLNFQHVEKLKLSKIAFCKKHFSTFCEELKQLTNISHLGLLEIIAEVEDTGGLLSSIKQLPNLESFEVSSGLLNSKEQFDLGFSISSGTLQLCSFTAQGVDANFWKGIQSADFSRNFHCTRLFVLPAMHSMAFRIREHNRTMKVLDRNKSFCATWSLLILFCYFKKCREKSYSIADFNTLNSIKKFLDLPSKDFGYPLETIPTLREVYARSTSPSLCTTS